MKNLFNVKATSATKWDGYKDTLDELDRATAKALTELEGMVKADLESLSVSILEGDSFSQSIEDIKEERQEAIEAMKKASDALLEAYHSVMDIEAL